MVGQDHALQHLWTELDTKVRHLEEDIARGNLPDYAQYRFLCGQIRGMAIAGEMIKDLAKKMEETIDE